MATPISFLTNRKHKLKKTLIALALIASFGAASAQDSNSTSNGTASSNASPTINTSVAPSVSTQSGNSSATGTVTGTASANPNNAQNIVFNSTSGGASTMDSTQRVTGGTTNTNRNINEGTSTSIQEVRYSGTTTVKSAPAIAMSGPASGPCTGVSGGVGVSGPGWGVGFNGSTVMDDCRIRENTRMLGMAMQSIDGGTNPQEKGEATVMFMEATRGLAEYNRQILGGALKQDNRK